MSPEQVLPLLVVHTTRLYLQHKLSLELLFTYAARCIELTLVVILVGGPGYFTFRNFRGVLLLIGQIVSIVGALSMSVEATADAVSSMSHFPELFVLFLVVQWLATPKGDYLNTFLFQLKGIEVAHLISSLVCLIAATTNRLVGRGISLLQQTHVWMVIQELVDDGAYIIRTYDIYSTIYSIDLSLNILYSHVWNIPHEAADYGAYMIGTYGLDKANMSPLTYTGMTIDLVFIFGVTGAIFLVLKHSLLSVTSHFA